MRYVGFVAALSVTVLAVGSAAGRDGLRGPPESPAIGALQEDDLGSLPYRCECEFFRGPINGATTVFATRQERTVAFARVGGRVVMLRRDGKPSDPTCRKNALKRERWAGDAASVVLDLRATKPGEEACWFAGRMNLTAGGRTASTKVSGACGC